MNREGAELIIWKKLSDRDKKWNGVTLSVRRSRCFLPKVRLLITAWGEWGYFRRATAKQRTEDCCWASYYTYGNLIVKYLPEEQGFLLGSGVVLKDSLRLFISELVSDIAFSACLQIPKESQFCSSLFSKRLLEIHPGYWLPQNLHTVFMSCWHQAIYEAK